MESDTRSGAPDWLLPAVLIVVALLVGLAGWGIYEVTREPEDPSLAHQLELYTACLSDHGANVPLVETRSDGGFVVIVPGSLLEHDVDLEQWAVARDECRALEPNPLELLFDAGGLDIGSLSPLLIPGLLDGGFDEGGPWQRFGDRRSPIGPPGADIRELCERAAHEDRIDDIERRALREVCELLND
jgi:hypothetical protein